MGALDDKTIDDTVEKMLKDLVAAVSEAAGQGLEPHVESWWRNQYKAKFFYALHKKGKKYDDEKAALLDKARQLGRRARDLAVGRPITTLDAAIASHSVDCPPTGSSQDWCN